MKFDYSFFQIHSRRSRMLQAPTVYYLSDPLAHFFGSEAAAEGHYEIVSRPTDIEDEVTPSIVRCNGAYFKGGESVAPLESCLRTKLPEDFVQFYAQFGESLIITRSEPVLIYPLQQMIDDFEDDPDIDVQEGRFFRFARYEDPLYLGLRRDDISDEWQVVICTYGLLYSEMIGPQGRRNVVASSFYTWLRNLIDTDGYPDRIYPRDGRVPYLSIVHE